MGFKKRRSHGSTSWFSTTKCHVLTVLQATQSLNGLTQAPRAWFERLHNFLTSVGFISSKSDSSLFFRFTNTSTMFILAYVHDILITRNSTDEIQALVTQLNATSSLKDLGDLHYFLGTGVLRTCNEIHLSQNKYILDLLKRAKNGSS